MARKDFRQQVTDSFIQRIEEDEVPWEMFLDNFAVRPFNPWTNTRFKGGNALNLTLSQIQRGSDDPRWMTLKQANEAGYSIREGAKATHVEYWDFAVNAVDENGYPSDGISDENAENPPRKPKPFYPAYFHAMDIIGLPPLKRDINWDPHVVAENLFVGTRALFQLPNEKTNVVKYDREEDVITAAHRQTFFSDSEYYPLVMHAMLRWTGHKSRLNRPEANEDSATFSKEQARLGIASMILTSALGLKPVVHSSYYKDRWIGLLREDKHEIFRAARDAEKMVDHLLDYVPELRQVLQYPVINNHLTKNRPKSSLDSGVSAGLPNFIPPEASKGPERNGKDDLRWNGFDKTVRAEAGKFGIDANTVEKALSMIELQFTDVMNTAKLKGYSADDMNAMLTRSIVDEMRTADFRQQQWERFCAQVKKVGGDLYPNEKIDLALQALGGRYQQLVGRSMQEEWSKEQTDVAIRSMIFGDEGRRPITPEYVKILVGNAANIAHKDKVEADDDDDFFLMPLGLADAMPEDTGAIADEHVFET